MLYERETRAIICVKIEINAFFVYSIRIADLLYFSEWVDKELSK